MTIELRAAVPTVVGNARVYVFSATADTVRLGIVTDGRETGPNTYQWGDELIIDETRHTLIATASPAPVGAAGRLVGSLEPSDDDTEEVR